MPLFRTAISYLFTGLSAVMALGFFLITYAYFFGAKTPEDQLQSCEDVVAAGGYLNIEDPIGQCLLDMEKGAGGADVLWIFSAIMFVLAILFYVMGKSFKRIPQ